MVFFGAFLYNGCMDKKKLLFIFNPHSGKGHLQKCTEAAAGRRDRCGSLQDGAGSGGFYHAPHHSGGYAGRQEIFVLPYRKVLHFGIQTAGFGDPLQASQLTVCFADEHEAKFGFIGQDDLFAVANAISRRIL